MNKNCSEFNKGPLEGLEKDSSGDDMTDSLDGDSISDFPFESVGPPAHLQHLVPSEITHDFESNPYIQYMQNALFGSSSAYSSPVSETPRPNFCIGKARNPKKVTKPSSRNKSSPAHDQHNLDMLSKAVETQKPPSPPPPPKSVDPPLSHPSNDLPPKSQFEMRTIQKMLIAFKQIPTPPDTDQIARIFAKMDLAYETNSAHGTHGIGITQTPSLPALSFATMGSSSEVPTFLFDTDCCVHENPKTDARLYFAHCYNWLESITGFCQTAAMKSHFTKLLDVLSAHCNDGIFIRDSSFRTLWVSKIFCERIEYERAELMSPTSTPFDYTDPASLLPLHIPFVRAMFDKNCLTTNFMLKCIAKKTRKVLPVFTKYWFFRNESGDLQFMATTITFCAV